MKIPRLKDKIVYSRDDVAVLYVHIEKIEKSRDEIGEQLRSAIERIIKLESRLEFYRNVTTKVVK